MKKTFSAMVAALMMVALVSSTAFAGSGFAPIKATGDRVQGDVGSCNNDWATVTLTKDYKLTRVTDTTYNLEVKEDGPFTTLAGASPGACEENDPPNGNGNTVAAGVTGTTHQTFDAIVTDLTPASAPDSTPECAAPCEGSGDFLNAVFGSGGWVRGDFSWTAHYTAGSNGTYFDTSVGWPRNNRGDITSPS